MKKTFVPALLLSFTMVQNISAAELIEKEPIKIQSEEIPPVTEENADRQPEASETNAETVSEANGKATDEIATVNSEARLQEQQEKIEKWKNAVKTAARNTSDMAEAVQNPNTNTEFSVYCKKGTLGFYYDKNRFTLHSAEISKPDHISEILLKSKDSADTRSELLIQYQESAENIEDIAQYTEDYYTSILAESIQADETNAEEHQEQNPSVSDSISELTDTIPVIGFTQMGAYNIPAFFVQTKNTYTHEEYYVVTTEKGCCTITLTAPLTEPDKLEEVRQILQSVIIENTDTWNQDIINNQANQKFKKFVDKFSIKESDFSRSIDSNGNQYLSIYKNSSEPAEIAPD